MWNRPDYMILPDGTSECYEYNREGRLRRILAGCEVVAEIDHNSGGQATKVRYGDGNRSSFAYDGNARVTEAQNQEIVARYKYDKAGRVLEEDHDGHLVRYHYNSSGTLIGLTYPSGETVEYGYDADLRLSYVKDWTGRAHKFVYARDDRGFTHYLPNGLNSTVRQSNSGLPVSIVATKADSRVRESGTTSQRSLDLFTFEYQYDEEDRVRFFRDSEFCTREYVYDLEGQVLRVRADTPAKSEEFAYDGAGNRIRANGDGATFNALNQLINQGRDTCKYDGRGNLVAAFGPIGAWSYTYNSQNLLVRAEGPQGKVVTFGYDAFGRRIWKRSSDSNIRFIWAGEQMVREIERHENATHVRDYLYFPGTYTPLAVRIDGTVYYYHTDHLGTPRRLSDEAGNIVWSGDYSAFGRVDTRTNNVSNPLRFPGHYFDPETGLHYNRFRYYSPLLGRYLSRDPVGFLAGLNLYVYAGNSPTNSADPSGLWSWGTVAAIAAGVAVGVAVIAFAPIALPLAIVAAGALGGAVAAGLGQALNEDHFCIACILNAAAKGALVGIVGALPFVLLPAAAGVAAYALAGGSSGGLGYTANYFANLPHATWNWAGFAAAVGIGAATAGVGSYLGPRIAEWLGGEGEQPLSPAGPEAEGEARRPTPGDSGFASDALLQSHFEDHGSDFGATTAAEYAQQADTFLNGPLESGALEKIRPNGDIVRYNPASEEFGVATADGTIRTYFKPDPAIHGLPSNLDYFNER
jgi:RHS repeat-associated protein